MSKKKCFNSLANFRERRILEGKNRDYQKIPKKIPKYTKNDYEA
jgi:hypothetical protein